MALTKMNNSGEKPIIKNPAILAVNFLLVGIVILFLAFSYGYFAFRDDSWAQFRLPRQFWLSTLLVVMVSVVLHQTTRLYDRDNVKGLRLAIGLSLFFAIAFVLSQYASWQTLKAQNIFLATSPSGSYVYLLIGLHVLHVLVGLIFLIVSFVRVYKNTGSQVNALLFFSDPVRRSRLKLLTTYWHTIDALWVYLFLSFLYNHT